MHKSIVANIVSRLVLIVSCLMVVPLVWAYHSGNVYQEADTFLQTMALGFLISTICLYAFPIKKEDIKRINAKDGLAIVGISWMVLSLLGSLPLWLTGVAGSFTNALFETVSGFTTTGATIFADIERLPKGILFWRSMTQWLGGMGIIVLYVALLPALGAHAFQLYKAEAPGISVERADPRIKETAKYLWGIYIAFTVILAFILKFNGMSVHDAWCHSFTTIASGGFSTKNASMAAFSPTIQWIVIVFMFLTGINYVLHYQLLIRRRPRALFYNEELRWYVGVVLVSILCIVLILEIQHPTDHSLRDAAFQTVAILTTTGYVTVDFDQWPNVLRKGLLLLMFIGGCGGSTSGGMKLIRWLVSWKVALLSIKQSVFPNAILPVKVNSKPLPDHMIRTVMSFFAVFMFLVFTGTFLFLFLENCDLETGFSAVVSALCNIGPGLGEIGATQNFGWISNPGKWLLSFLMLAGRLELYSILILFIPATWKK